MSAETMVVTGTCACHAEQIGMRIDSIHDGANGGEEHGILMRVLPRIKQIALAIRNAPVVVLTRTVHACKRLFVQQANKTVAVGDIPERFHHEHVVVASEVHFFKERSEFELSRGHFVMARLCRDAKFPQFLFHIVHKVQDAARDTAKVMVIHLLVLRWRCTENRATGLIQVRTLQIKSFIDEEIFLFGAKRDRRLLWAGLETGHEATSRLGKRLQATEERSLLVESFASVATKSGRNAKRSTVAMALDKRRRRRVPSGIAASFERRTKSATRKTGGVRFTDNQVLAAQNHNRLATGWFKETIMLFGCRTGQRLKPMRKVRCAAIHRPAFHGVSDIACNARVKRDAFVNRRKQLFTNIFRKIGAHSIGVENIFTIEIDVHGSGRHGTAHRGSCDIVDGLITTIIHFLPVFFKSYRSG